MSNTESMFEQASRLKLRFESTRGLLSTEDLWDLSLTGTTRTNLDSIAIALHKQTKDLSDVVSFVNPSSDRGSNELLLKFEIVKYIISVRVRERDEAKAAADRREKKQRILELIAQKQDAALAEKSEEELRALAESL